MITREIFSKQQTRFKRGYASNNRRIPRKSKSFNIDAVEEELDNYDNDTRKGCREYNRKY